MNGNLLCHYPPPPTDHISTIDHHPFPSNDPIRNHPNPLEFICANSLCSKVAALKLKKKKTANRNNSKACALKQFAAIIRNIKFHNSHTHDFHAQSRQQKSERAFPAKLFYKNTVPLTHPLTVITINNGPIAKSPFFAT